MAARAGGLGSSAPSVARWLGDIRRYFPTPVVQVLQRDAIDRLNLRQLLLEPEMLRAVEPDLHLVTLLVELNKLLPDATRATARQVVAQVVDQIEQRLGDAHQAGRARRAGPQPAQPPAAARRHRLGAHHPRQPAPLPARAAHGRPRAAVGYGRRQRSLSRDVIIAIDQSGSMADSVVYAAVFGAVLASMPALRTSVVAFDTAVADLTPLLHDPVDVLFGVQLGGGTDIAQAIGYCQQLVTRPADTVLVLVSDLFEGGNAALLHDRVAALRQAGVTRGGAAGAQRRGRAGLRPRPGRGRSPSSACRRWPARPTPSPSCWPRRWSGRDVGRWANEHGLHTAVPAAGSPMIIRHGTEADVEACNDVWVSTQPDLGDEPLPDAAVGATRARHRSADRRRGRRRGGRLRRQR